MITTLDGLHRLGRRTTAAKRVGHHHGVGVFRQAHVVDAATKRVAPLEGERCFLHYATVAVPSAAPQHVTGEVKVDSSMSVSFRTPITNVESACIQSGQ